MNSSTLALPRHETRAAVADRRGAPAPFLPFARISVRTAIWSVLLGIGLIAPFMIIAAYFPSSGPLRSKMTDIWFHPLAFLVASGFIGPLLEEIVYRGFFQGILRRYSPLWVAILVPSLVFAATHIIPAGWAYINLCHCTFNITAGLALTPIFNLAEKHLERTPGAPFNPAADLFPIWWIALSLVLIASAVVMIHRDTASRHAARSS
jgi:membrane protease YdiL (CAAX protease family)